MFFPSRMGMGTRAGVTLVSPDELFGGGENGGWWDFSDASTVYVERTGSPPSTLASNGSALGSVADKSGVGAYLRAFNDANRPTYTTSGGGGGTFVGTNSNALRATLSAVTSSSMYVAVVGSFTSSATNKRVVSMGTTGNDFDTANNAIAMNCDPDPTFKFEAVRNSVTSAQPGSTSSGTTYLLETIYDGSNQTLYVNTTAGTPQTNTGSFNFTIFSLGAHFLEASASTTYVDGIYREVVAINRTLTSDELAGVRAYLNNKWSIY